MNINEYSPMSPGARHNWLRDMTWQVSEDLFQRYVEGQESHGGFDLGSVSTEDLVSEIEREAMDILIYIQELKRRKGNQSNAQSE